MAIVIIVSTGAATYFNAFVAAAEFVVICLQACCCVSEPLLFTIHSALIYEIKLHKHFVNTIPCVTKNLQKLQIQNIFTLLAQSYEMPGNQARYLRPRQFETKIL